MQLLLFLFLIETKRKQKRSEAKQNELALSNSLNIPALPKKEIRKGCDFVSFIVSLKFPPSMSDLGPYQRSYPYYSIEDNSQQYWSAALEDSFFLLDQASKENPSQCRLFDDLVFLLRYLEEKNYVKPASSAFIDCLGNGGVSALLAVCFRYKQVISVEQIEDNLQVGRKLWKALRESNPAIKATAKFKYGSFLDYFDYGCEVVFFNASEVPPTLAIDEGFLLHLFLRMCANLLPGTIIIVFTSCLSLQTEDCKRMGFEYLQTIFHVARSEERALHNFILQKC